MQMSEAELVGDGICEREDCDNRRSLVGRREEN